MITNNPTKRIEFHFGKEGIDACLFMMWDNSLWYVIRNWIKIHTIKRERCKEMFGEID